MEEERALVVRDGWQVTITAPHRKGGRLILSVAKPRVVARDAMRLDAPPSMSFTREGATTRLGKRLGLDREAQSGHAGFDERVYIGSDDVPAAYVQAALKQEALRVSVEHLLDHDYQYITTHTGELLVQAVASQAPLSAAQLEEDLSALLQLARALPEARYGEAPARRSLRAIITASAVMMLGCWVFLTILAPTPPAEPGLGLWHILLTVAIWLPSVLFMTRLARGRAYAGASSSTRSGLFSVGAPAVAALLAPALSARLDTSAPERVEAFVLTKQVRRHHPHRKNPTIHHTMSFGTKDGSLKTPETLVSRARYASLPEAGQPVTLDIGRGAFRVRWIAAIGARASTR